MYYPVPRSRMFQPCHAGRTKTVRARGDDGTMALTRLPDIVVTYTHTISFNRGFSDTW